MRVPTVRRGRAISVMVDGSPLQCFEGETIAAAMIAGGRNVFRCDSLGRPRSLYCNMGVCCECMVIVGDVRVRACLTDAADGMSIFTAFHGRS